METFILIGALVLIYYNVAGLATTNMLRLTTGNSLSVLSSRCVCDNCGAAITPVFQLPVISYLLCRGRCRSCNIPLPVDVLFLELAVWIGMLLITVWASFAPAGVLLAFLYYELLRMAVIFKKGKRNNGFSKQYIIALLSMIPHLTVALIAYFILLVL